MGFKAKSKAAKSKAAKPKQQKPNPKPKPAKPTPPREYFFDISDFHSPDHYHQYIRYVQRLEACGPFDLDFFPDSSVALFGLIYPCGYEYGCCREDVEKCVRHAIAYAKKEKKMELEDPKVVNANLQGHSGTMYYITFDAKDKRSRKRQLYHAKVLYRRWTRDIYVRLIRVKNSQKKCRSF